MTSDRELLKLFKFLVFSHNLKGQSGVSQSWGFAVRHFGISYCAYYCQWWSNRPGQGQKIAAAREGVEHSVWSGRGRPAAELSCRAFEFGIVVQPADCSTALGIAGLRPLEFVEPLVFSTPIHLGSIAVVWSGSHDNFL